VESLLTPIRIEIRPRALTVIAPPVIEAAAADAPPARRLVEA
jgi:hypothetical protein